MHTLNSVGSLSVGLFIEGVEFPLQHAPFSINMYTNVRSILPTANISIADPFSLIGVNKNQIQLIEGSPIRIEIRGKDFKRSYSHRVFNVERNTHNNVRVYSISSYYDAPRYLSDSTSRSYRGSTSEVINKLTTECGLTFKGTTTNDSQAWLGANDKIGLFCRYLMKHGFKDSNSFMSLGVTLTGEARYYDMNDTSSKPFNMMFGITPSGRDILLHDAKVNASSGLANTCGVYRYLFVEQNIDKAAIHKTSNVTRRAETENFNSELKEGIQRGRVDFSPIDLVNVHKQWAKAEYQNIRAGLINSVGVRVQTSMNTEADVLDQVRTSLKNSVGLSGVDENSGQYDGLYFITDKAVRIDTNHYVETFDLAREGIMFPRSN